MTTNRTPRQVRLTATTLGILARFGKSPSRSANCNWAVQEMADTREALAALLCQVLNPDATDEQRATDARQYAHDLTGPSLVQTLKSQLRSENLIG